MGWDLVGGVGGGGIGQDRGKSYIDFLWCLGNLFWVGSVTCDAACVG